jgi:hypothetical protein
MIRIPHRVLSAKTIADDIAWGRTESERLSQPVALLLPPGVLETGERGAVAGRGAAEGEPSEYGNAVAGRGAAEGEPSEYKKCLRVAGRGAAEGEPSGYRNA